MPNLTYVAHDRIIASWPKPWSIGLLTAAPNPNGTGVLEPATSDGYARQPVADGEMDVSQSDGITHLVNNQNIVFGPAIPTQWPAVNYFGLFDANGVLVLYGRLRTSRIVPTGETETFSAGAITLRLR